MKRENQQSRPSEGRGQSRAETRAEALSDALSAIEKEYGRGAVMRMGDAAMRGMQVVPTGAYAVDLAVGVGGLPRGRIVEIYGEESSGKSTLALSVAAEAQKRGGTVALIDAEHAFDRDYCQGIGMDVDSVIISQPDYGEMALGIAERLIGSGAVDVVVVDSVAALIPRGELEGDMTDNRDRTQHARLMSKALRRLTAAIGRTNTLCIFTNQMRTRLGDLLTGDMETTGGTALKFYSSVRLRLSGGAVVKDMSGNTIGRETMVRVVKNKVSPPFRKTRIVVRFGAGIDRWYDLLQAGLELGVLRMSAMWYSFGDRRLGAGEDGARQTLIQQPRLCGEVEAAVRKALAERTGQTEVVGEYIGQFTKEKWDGPEDAYVSGFPPSLQD